MKSITRAVPVAVCHCACRISVSPWYRRVASPVPGGGATRQWPLLSSPSRPAKQAGESNLGRHSQSTEPSRPTSAADCMSPMMA